MMDKKYGPGKWEDAGPGGEFNKIKKWADRHNRLPHPVLSLGVGRLPLCGCVIEQQETDFRLER